jgi:hypothetical protein
MYFVSTNNRLPSYKFLCHHMSSVWQMIEEMIDRKPKDIPFNTVTDLERSIHIVRFDEEQVVNYEKIFLQSPFYDWGRLRKKEKKEISIIQEMKRRD